jgi:hypothetical protein
MAGEYRPSSCSVFRAGSVTAPAPSSIAAHSISMSSSEPPDWPTAPTTLTVADIAAMTTSST